MLARLRMLSRESLGHIAGALIRALRHTDPDRLSDNLAGFMRRIGPWLPENRTGRANLAAAFPEKSPDEIERLLSDVWASLGRLAAEFIHLDRLWDYEVGRTIGGRIEADAQSEARFGKLLEDGRGALIFSAHLGNWELPAVAAPAHGLPSAVLYRRPNISSANRIVEQLRTVSMGRLIPTTRQAPFQLAEALDNNEHVGMLVDQWFSRGVPVTFFGRTTMANPLIARLLRHREVPLHGTRAIRLPGHRFRLEITDEIQPARDAAGEIDIQATMQRITTVIEGWIRETPEQWLWLHRRWR